MTETQQLTKPSTQGKPDAPDPVGKPPSGNLVSQMGKGATVMVIMTLMASGLNYASNLIFSRVLGPDSFGDLTALLALLIVIAVPTAAAQTIIAERIASYRVAERPDKIRYLIRHATAHVTVVAILVGVVYGLSIPLVVEVLDLQAVGPAIALLPLIVLTFMAPVALGALAGMDRYLALGAMVLAIAASRIAFGVPWAYTAEGGSGGAIAGQALGVAVVLIGAGWLLRKNLIGRGTGAASSGLRRRPNVRTVTASLAFIAFAVVTNLDIVLAKLFMTSHDAGIYAALATVGKLVLFLPAAIAVVMVPSAARARHTKGDSARVLRIAALLVLLTTAIVAIPAAIAPQQLVETMFGADYSGASGGVLAIVCAGAGSALLYLLVVYTVAIEDRWWTALLGCGIVLQVIGIALFHDTPAQVALVQAAVMGLLLIGNEIGFHSLIRKPRGSIVDEAQTE